jgi:hypothetical protein
MTSQPGVTGRKSGQSEPAFNPAIINDPIYTEREMAARLRVSIFTLRRWRKVGKIAYIQLTERTFGYRQSFGDRLLEGCTVHPVETVGNVETVA